ncbi:TIM barrel protein [Halorubrum sp. CBA1125]|uniref:sugar phosphate isomerase/epimerase family protein n=1 Tax=Halorubrum sp. CBA1125 TaxID=2668072 RepID=UPI0012E70BA2|nr:sugar phosphate isomerase/epimerase family protein [Halorubrum sp. CBA1125]MUW14631.1 TIM barrel protein [Halorubrum sp. CBA1125]
MPKYTYNTLSYVDDDSFAQSAERLARYGYDGVEILGEPSKVDTEAAKTALEEHGLEASSVGTVYTETRDMTAADPEIRENGVEFTIENVEVAAELGADVVCLSPNYVGKVEPEDPRYREWAIEGLSRVVDYVNERGYDLTLGLEPWNRYETHVLNTVGDCLETLAELPDGNVGVWADLFHMNIEETSPGAAIREAGDDLVHLHVADTNRQVPGAGHYDWEPVVEALEAIGYDGYLSFEVLPATADPYDVLLSDEVDATPYHDEYTRRAIEFMEDAWAAYV